MRPLLLSLVAIVSFAFGQTVYVLQDDYTAGSTAGSFADNFDFFTDNDPTNGYVNYVSQAAAINSGLLSTLPDGSIYMGVDHTNVATGRGRNSIRIESKKVYNHGLFILDLAHMPGGQCATWPAFWLKSPAAQSYSELDIIEGINLDSTSLLSLKTSQACSISQQPMTGTLRTTDCNINTGGIVGCSIDSASPSTYGTGFNSQGGGVYATEWTSDAITIWSFARNSVPADILAGTPQTALWGAPLAKFAPSCRLDDSFVNQNLVMNIDFCGDYAADPFWYNQYPACTSQAASCNAFVRDNPGAFVDTYWQINQLKIYQQSTPSTTSSSTTTGSTSSTSSPSPLPASTTSGSGLSSSITSHSEASTTSGFTAAPTVTLTTSTGYGVFTPGLPNPPSSNIQPIGLSTTTSTGIFVFTPGLPNLPSSSIQPAVRSSTTSTGIFVFTPGLPNPSSYTSLEYIPSSSSSSSFAIGPIGGSTTSALSSQSTIGQLPGSASTSSPQYSTLASSAIVDPNLGSTTSSSSTVSYTSASSLASSFSTTPKKSSSINLHHTSSPSKSPLSPTQSGVEGWGGHRISSTIITTTLKGTWIEPCPTGLTTRTTSFVTTHCGCTEQPLPTFSLTTITITCPPGWPITTPYVITKPLQPEQTAHGVIVTIDHGHEATVTTDRSGKTITITGPVVDPTKTVVVPVTVIPLPPAGPNAHGAPGAPSGTIFTKTGSASSLGQGNGNGAGGGAPTPAVEAPHSFPSAPGAAAPGSNGGSTGNNDNSSNGHLPAGTDGGDSSSSGSNNGGSSNGVDSNSNGYGNQDIAAPSSSTWIASYTGAAATVVTSSTLFLALAIISFIFLELSVI